MICCTNCQAEARRSDDHTACKRHPGAVTCSECRIPTVGPCIACYKRKGPVGAARTAVAKHLATGHTRVALGTCARCFECRWHWRRRSQRVGCVLEQAELARLRAACASATECAILSVMYDFALRASEVALLTTDDFDARRATWRVGRVKDGLVYDLGVSPSTQTDVSALEGQKRLFAAWPAARIRYWFRELCKRAGVDSSKSFSHVLRRSRASHLLDAGATVAQVQRRLGHRSPATTLRYLGLSKIMETKSDELAASQMASVFGGE